MTCSATLIEPKNKFLSRIAQLFTCADVEVNVQRPWKILSSLAPHKPRALIYSNFQKYLQLNFFARILKSHRYNDNCADTIFLNHVK